MVGSRSERRECRGNAVHLRHVLGDVSHPVHRLIIVVAHPLPRQCICAPKELSRYVDHHQVPPQQLLLQSDLSRGLHLLHVGAVDDGDERLVVRPNCEAIAAQGEVGCLLEGVHQARELSETLDMTSEGLEEMFKCDSTDKCGLNVRSC